MKQPDFESIKGKRMCDLTDQEQQDALELWIRANKGWMGQSVDHISFLLTRLDEARLPIDMVLYCPQCGRQHIDEPTGCDMGMGCSEAGICYATNNGAPERCTLWTNPPHKSHLCAGCGFIWRPADVPTNGVWAIETRGKEDSPMVSIDLHYVTKGKDDGPQFEDGPDSEGFHGPRPWNGRKA